MFIPLLTPGNLPMVLLLTAMPGIPTMIVALLVFFVIEHIPSRNARLLLPPVCAVLLAAFAILSTPAPFSDEEYRRTWAAMMAMSFLLGALLILAPFPFIRPRIGTLSPYLAVGIAVPVTFFLLAGFGFIGGDAVRPPATDAERTARILTVYIAETGIAALVYGALAVWARVTGTADPGPLPGNR